MNSVHAELKVLIIDDEHDACQNLKNVLNKYVDTPIDIVGIANSTKDAEKQITMLQPDAIFLDIKMPNENAFSFLNRISPFSFEVIFVTAYDEYAVKAFKLNAIDYILKPISIDEVKSAVQKLTERISYKQFIKTDDRYRHLADTLTKKNNLHHIIFRDSNNLEIVEFANIYFIEAKGSYSRIIFSRNGIEKEIVMSHSIAEYEELVPTELFFRIHKSYLVNCVHIKQIVNGDNLFAIVNETYNLPISRRRYPALTAFLKM